MRIIILLLAVLVSCNLFDEKKDNTAIARAENKYLIYSDI